MVKTLPSNAGDVGLISGQGAKIVHEHCKDFKKRSTLKKKFKKKIKQKTGTVLLSEQP